LGMQIPAYNSMNMGLLVFLCTLSYQREMINGFSKKIGPAFPLAPQFINLRWLPDKPGFQGERTIFVGINKIDLVLTSFHWEPVSHGIGVR
jgi:hypothetical protein